MALRLQLRCGSSDKQRTVFFDSNELLGEQ